MNEVEPQPNTEIAPSVAALLEVFHEQTSEKLAIAPVDSVALCHLTTGIVEVDEDGWCTDYDNMDERDAIDVQGRRSRNIMSANTSPNPGEPDVHLSVFLHGARFDFAACLTAALVFVREYQARHYADAVTMDLGDTSGYPRLPCERLYLEPGGETPIR